MMRCAQAFMVFVALGFVVPVVLAEDRDVPCPETQAALEALISRSSRSPVWKVSGAGEGFSLTRLLIAEDGADPADKARRFLATHRDLWCVGDAALEVTDYDRSNGGSVVRARLTVGEIPVVDAGVRLKFTRAGQVSAVYSGMPSRMELDGTFALTREEAGAAAAGAPGLKKSGGVAGGECSAVYFRIGRRLVPAYRCALVAPDIISSHAVFVSAVDGDLIAVRPMAIGKPEVER